MSDLLTGPVKPKTRRKPGSKRRQGSKAVGQAVGVLRKLIEDTGNGLTVDQRVELARELAHLAQGYTTEVIKT